jgi:hypothetical protein
MGPFGPMIFLAIQVAKHWDAIKDKFVAIWNFLKPIIGKIIQATQSLSSFSVPGIIGKGLSILGGKADGGMVNRAGVYTVHRRENVYMPQGAYVQPAAAAAAGGDGGGGDFIVPVTVMTADGDVLGRATARAARRKKASR